MSAAGSAERPSVIFLMGPTATGKTDLAVRLLDQLPAEIISVDSALVYRGMTIGTAKPDAELLARAPHHLVDIRDPSEAFSAAEFATAARALIADICERGKVPLLVGGSMLYFRVLLDGLSDLPPSDPTVRAEILAAAAEHGWPYLHRQLMAVDPVTAAGLHPNHSQRIQRALEIYRLSGVAASQLRQQAGESAIPPLDEHYRVAQLGLLINSRPLLHQRIAQRFHQMLDQGLVDEVERLWQRGDLTADLPAIRSVGYRQVWGYLAGEYDYDEMVAKGIAATRQLAKRQLTWLRRWPGLQPLMIDEPAGILLDSQLLTAKCLNILQNGPIY